MSVHRKVQLQRRRESPLTHHSIADASAGVLEVMWWSRFSGQRKSKPLDGAEFVTTNTNGQGSICIWDNDRYETIFLTIRAVSHILGWTRG